ncbi:ferrous iron transport protein A [Schaalia sp. ZJ405]|uniref:FeoA family protein n=1 Tax=unclassified Schaalia TaxID=2691889 RepID=UPI0013EA2449|nr:MULTISPECIES: FeoA family protein [unclassified Schaalia]QPK81535.1 ferrous iron transport protein A [Schaalia sp. ZJ405]
MLLSSCVPNTRGRLLAVNVEPAHRLRLEELGVRVGAQFFLANRAAFGGIVVNIAGTRVAVDARSARRIEVEELA